ncbi:MAG: hypothetical protein WAN93_13465 [Solirubrobacteraceae bacterium]
MRIEVLYFDGCPNHEPLLDRLRDTLAALGVSAAIDLCRIAGDAEAQRERFIGSPTIRINGHDIEPGADERTDFGMKCRLYRTTSGLAGQPQDELLQAAIRSSAR